MQVETKLAGSTAFLAAAAAAAASNSAMAADLYTKAPPVIAPSTWQGFYVGANIGASWLNSTQDDTAASLLGYYGGNGSSQKSSSLGFIGGLQAGYNFQDGKFVYGLEGDFSWLASDKATSTSSLTTYYGGYGLTGEKTSKVQALGTVRARFGFDLGGTMPYLTGGLAVGQIKNTYSVGYAGGTVLSASKTSWEPGLALGAGIEHKFAGTPWSIKGEAMWIGFKDTHMDAPSAYTGYTPGTINFKNEMITAKIGLNYRF